MKIKCIICKKLTEAKSKKKMYCSRKCQDRADYLHNKLKIIARVKNWQRRNPEKVRVMRKKSIDKFRKNKPERFNELMRNGYKRNRKKWYGRNITNMHREEILKVLGHKCKCGSKKNLEIHHLDYKWETNYKKTSYLLNIDKVEVLCRKCHRKLHKSKTI